ncbi:hypothetical protein BU24DRAFT_91721 [Aaosphaeria arxii CBS 175.79]|uniref:C2H2 finger domain protein n=1 Tax=Aaosphaeria arxii CBS 175.79 TaxID=1450172 RepID=A0A6A5X7B4_9PLEO|nr:uncharacterized protein BU24DRAFT_91721 [Aaosphaeria arxii CBS 175.79]KAF2008799.1 hypothetical protein BU24DRAFT_91721 [Aaosphaeria arxii CBS 175.79]
MRKPTPIGEKAVVEYRCHICEKKFATSSRLRRHDATHSIIRAYQCTHCSQNFKRHDALRRHSRTCSNGQVVSPLKRGPKPRSCDHCHIKKLQCSATQPCNSCLISKITCSYTHASHRDTVIGLDRVAAKHGTETSTKSATTTSHHLAMVFLLNYTDPSFETVTDAMAAVGARVQAVVHFPWLHQLSNDVFDQPSDVGISDYFPFTTDDERLDFGITPSEYNLEPVRKDRASEVQSILAQEYSRTPAALPLSEGIFPTRLARTVFTLDNITDFVSAYFTFFHPHFAFIHRPTFDLETASLPLVLALALSGSAHLTPRDDALAAREFYVLSEEYIFRQLRQAVADGGSPNDVRVIEIVQAAQVMHSLLASSNDEPTRRRIRVNRHPELIASMRSLGFTEIRRVHRPVDVEWDVFIAEETRIRLVAGMFVVDSMIVLFLNNPPHITLSEMSSDLPYPDALFEASSAAHFKRVACQSSQSPSRSLCGLMMALLRDGWHWSDDLRFASMNPKTMLLLIFAINSAIFVARTSLLSSSSSQSLYRALDRWKDLWDDMNSNEEIDHSQFVGFTKHCLELWWLGRKLVDKMSKGDVGEEYMKATPKDSFTALHEFIRSNVG